VPRRHLSPEVAQPRDLLAVVLKTAKANPLEPPEVDERAAPELGSFAGFRLLLYGCCGECPEKRGRMMHRCWSDFIWQMSVRPSADRRNGSSGQPAWEAWGG
jgi:hypothetical protein